MNITEKILAIHSGNKEVWPGELIDVHVDLVLSNDDDLNQTVEALTAFIVSHDHAVAAPV